MDHPVQVLSAINTVDFLFTVSIVHVDVLAFLGV